VELLGIGKKRKENVYDVRAWLPSSFVEDAEERVEKFIVSVGQGKGWEELGF